MSARESDLIDAVQPIRGLALATSIYHFFSSGLFDRLADSPEPSKLTTLAEELQFEVSRSAS